MRCGGSGSANSAQRSRRAGWRSTALDVPDLGLAVLLPANPVKPTDTGLDPRAGGREVHDSAAGLPAALLAPTPQAVES